MVRSSLTALTVMVVLGAGVAAEDPKLAKEKDSVRSTNVTISKIDVKKGEITVRYVDDKGKQQERILPLTKEVRIVDETGRPIKIEVFEPGAEAVVMESAGKLLEFRRAPLGRTRQISDTVRTLIEMSEYDQGCAAEVQKIYDLLRKLDAKKDGKIDPQALKTEADLILQERINDVFTRLDTNKDGKISREEARGLIKADFDKIDTNKDGFIDRDELLKAARARQQQAADSKATDPKPTEKEKK